MFSKYPKVYRFYLKKVFEKSGNGGNVQIMMSSDSGETFLKMTTKAKFLFHLNTFLSLQLPKFLLERNFFRLNPSDCMGER